jgi:hypothetical protein
MELSVPVASGDVAASSPERENQVSSSVPSLASDRQRAWAKERC